MKNASKYYLCVRYYLFDQNSYVPQFINLFNILKNSRIEKTGSIIRSK